jgi:hypothetical protein
MNTRNLIGLSVFFTLVCTQNAVIAAEKSVKSSKKSAVKIDSSSDPDEFVAAPSTRIDFSETVIDGKMKAPEGFMLQGQQGNSLSQMVKLRSNFRNQLNNSKSATKALVK